MESIDCGICGTSIESVKIIKYMTFDMCPDCYATEHSLQAEIKATEHIRVKEMHEQAKTLASARAIDNLTRINGDIYNAATVSIVDLEKIISEDDTIPAEQKYFMLAKEVSDRRNKLEGLISSKKTELDNLQTEQLVHQRKINELAEKLSKEERDKLKIVAINYKPQLTKDKVKIPTIGKKSENLAIVLRDYPKMDLDDAKLAALYLDKMNRTAQVMTTADAVNFVNGTK